MDKKDGGPAFPSKWINVGNANSIAPNGQRVPPGGEADLPGMSLRDYFAAVALQGWLASYAGHDAPHPIDSETKGRRIAEQSYAMADAMLAEREKTKGEL